MFQILNDEGWDFGLRSADEIHVSLPEGELRGAEFFASTSLPPDLHFEPHPGWRGAIEIDARLRAGAAEDRTQAERRTRTEAARSGPLS